MAYNPNNNPYVPGDPYSYDLKWLVTKVKELVTEYTALAGLPADFTDLYNYVHDYFDNLDISAELAPLVQEAIDNGEFDAAIYAQVQALASNMALILVDTDQSEIFTETEKSTARKNIRAADGNINILDNPYFRINQRGFSTVTVTGTHITVDRWKVIGTNGSCSLVSGKIELTRTNTDIVFRQQTILAPQIVNRPCCFSAIIDGELCEIGTNTLTTAGIGRTFTINNKDVRLSIEYNSTGFFANIKLLTDNAVITISAAKLETANHSTLNCDTPRTDHEELNRCMAYFQRIGPSGSNVGQIGGGVASSQTAATFSLFTTPMRALPSLSYSGTINVRSSGSVIAISNISLSTTSINEIGCYNLTLTPSTNLTPDEPLRISMTAGSYIDLSSDI